MEEEKDKEGKNSKRIEMEREQSVDGLQNFFFCFVLVSLFCFFKYFFFY